ncbi:MAG: hypothetical protein SGPRY_002613 [Prymnesium sp.]
MALLLSSLTTALVLGPRLSAPLRRAARCEGVVCGFEVESLSDNDVLEMNVMNWPGLEKRTSSFSQSAGEDEVKMVYVKEGKAVVSDAEETKSVGPGNLIMIQGGETTWDVSDGALTLISLVTATDEVTGEGVEATVEAPPEDLSLKEGALLLGGGLLFGGFLAFLSRMVQSM